MILLSYSNSSIKGIEILGSVLYLSLLRQAIFVCMQSGRKLIIFHFNSWLSFQRLCRLLQGYKSVIQSVNQSIKILSQAKRLND